MFHIHTHTQSHTAHLHYSAFGECQDRNVSNQTASAEQFPRTGSCQRCQRRVTPRIYLGTSSNLLAGAHCAVATAAATKGKHAHSFSARAGDEPQNPGRSAMAAAAAAAAAAVRSNNSLIRLRQHLSSSRAVAAVHTWRQVLEIIFFFFCHDERRRQELSPTGLHPRGRPPPPPAPSPRKRNLGWRYS